MSDLQMQDASSLHTYRTELPNIIYDLGLTLSEIGFYSYLKKVAGDHKSCFMSIATLAKNLGCSENAIRGYKKTLLLPRKELNGLALIVMEKRKTEKGNNSTDLIKIVDIWPINFYNKMFNTGAKIEPGVVQNLNQGGSKFEPKEEHVKKIPIKKTTTSVVVSSHIELLKDLKLSEADKLSLNKFTPERLRLAIEFANAVKYKTTLIQQLTWHCSQTVPPVHKEPLKSKVVTFFKHGGYYNGAECYLNDKGIGFQRGNTHAQIDFGTSDFDARLECVLKQFSIKME